METQALDTKSLYDRLGRDEGIAALVEDIVAAHMRNPIIKARFLPYKNEPERLEEIKGHLHTFLVTGSGGPGEYTGRSMPETHRGMNVSAQEYMAAIDDIMQVLIKHSIDEQSQKDVLAIAYSLKEEIVHQ